MSKVFIFPGDYFKQNAADELFVEQTSAINRSGYKCIYINIDDLQKLNSLPYDLSGQTIVYRGWMLNEDNYKKIEQLVANASGKMFISTQMYLLAHYLPRWYPLISDLSPDTKVFEYKENLSINLPNIKWKKFFIKDYVKSLKTSKGSVIGNINILPEVIEEMKKYRGAIEGGICIREFEDYLPETETRYFAINGIPFGPNSKTEIPSIVYECCKRINHPFFSIDVIKTIHGKDRIVEIGDGQVSDYVGWDVNRFVEVLGMLSIE